MLVRQTLQPPINGVSRRSSTQRDSSEGDEQVNGWSDYTHGLTKRPPSRHLATMESPGVYYGDALIHGIRISDAKKFAVLFEKDGVIEVYDRDGGGSVPVHVLGNADDYVRCDSPRRDIRVSDAGPSAIVTNRTVTVARDNARSPGRPPEAYISVRQADYSTQYAVSLDGSEVSFTTPAGSGSGARGEISTDAIASTLLALLQGSTRFLDFDFQQLGSTIRVSRTDAADFTIAGRDGLADTGLQIVKGTVQRLEDLPPRADDGAVLRVTGDPGSKLDDFYVVYTASDNVQDRGVWRETVAPDLLTHMDADTLPHLLSYRGSIIGDRAAEGAPAQPVIGASSGGPALGDWSKDFQGSPVGAGDTRPRFWDHNASMWGTSDAFDGGEVTIRIYYDVDTTRIEPDRSFNLALAVNEGPDSQVWTDLAIREHGSGTMAMDEYIEVTAAIPTGASIRVTTLYDNAENPALWRRGSIWVHAKTWPGTPGPQITKDEADLYTLPDIVWPVGSTFEVRIGEDEYTYTVAGSAEDTEEVLSELASIIGSDYTVTTPESFTLQVADSGSPVRIRAWNEVDGGVFYAPGMGLEPGALVGATIQNVADGSEGTITANSTDTIEAELFGGFHDEFRPGDNARVILDGDYFVFSAAPWKGREVGDDRTNPWPSVVDREVYSARLHRGRLVLVTGDKVLMSRANDLFNLFRHTAAEILDDDLIDVSVSSPSITALHDAVEWNGMLYLRSETGDVVLLSEGPLTPSSVQVVTANAIGTTGEVPATLLGLRLVCAHFDRGYVKVSEVYPVDNLGHTEQAHLTEHIRNYIVGEIRALVAGRDALFLVTTGGMYVYRELRNGETSLMRSWGKWEFSCGNTEDLEVVDDEVWLLRTYGAEAAIEIIDCQVTEALGQ